MILLVSPSQRAIAIADELQNAIGEQVEVAPTIRRAKAVLRLTECNALVLDEPVLESEPEAFEALLKPAGIAPPMYVNLASAALSASFAR